MESLAFVVGVILLTMILAGPIAIGLTFIRSANPALNIVRRIIIALLCALGMGLGIGLILEGVAIGATFFALFAILASAYALKREFGRR
jgi:hypothetical protein